jgi:cell division protein FtsZ
MQGAKGVIISIIGGEDMKLLEVDEAANHIRELVDPDANIIWGSAFNPDLKGKIRVSVVATGIEQTPAASPTRTARFPPAAAGSSAEVIRTGRLPNRRLPLRPPLPLARQPVAVPFSSAWQTCLAPPPGRKRTRRRKEVRACTSRASLAGRRTSRPFSA